MPRGVPNFPNTTEVPQQIFIQNPPQKPVDHIVNDYLKDDYYELKKKLNIDLECSICLDKICCKKCLALLPCGHTFHLCCLLKCNSCPLCRAN